MHVSPPFVGLRLGSGNGNNSLIPQLLYYLVLSCPHAVINLWCEDEDNIKYTQNRHISCSKKDQNNQSHNAQWIEHHIKFHV